MDESAPDQPSQTGHLLDVALAQLREDARVYDEAVESFNGHLENHRERRDLHALPPREPIGEHGSFALALEGDREAIASLLSNLLEEPRLDSVVRTHPRVYPIHLEAIEHLEIARRRLVATLEDGVRHYDAD